MIITVTGQDGSGKTGLIREIKEHYSDKKVKLLHLPFSDFAHKALAVSGEGLPFGDVHTDRLIFALDNRLASYKIKELSFNYDVIILQRGWMDSFIHGAVQGYNYSAIAKLTRIDQLTASTCSIYLNCQPGIAYKRIENDKNKDKFETLQYMTKQYAQTKSFYDSIDQDELLSKIFTEPRHYIDTSYLNEKDVINSAKIFLDSLST